MFNQELLNIYKEWLIINIMCGIFTLITKEGIFSKEKIENSFIKGRKRGPEFSSFKLITKKKHNIKDYNTNVYFGFHRLAINGLNENGEQPIEIDNIVLICNGEIYNYKKLFCEMNIIPKTTSDCEVIIHLYKRYGIEQTLKLLDGVFSFVIYDKNDNKMFYARDPYGVRPLFLVSYKEANEAPVIGIASELKMLIDLISLKDNITDKILEQVTPGSYGTIVLNCFNNFKIYKRNEKYNMLNFSKVTESIDLGYETKILGLIKENLINSVEKRVETTERPIACLLSGGLDSSLITSLVASKVYKMSKKQIETFTIGFEGSEDLKNARVVAEHLNTIHSEIIVKEQDFIDAIPEVIEKIESYDTTTIRASVGNYLVSKYISENSYAKVIFNGDGADELMGGYLYFHYCNDFIEFDKECRRLMNNIHYFDVLRSDRTISSNGLEPRTPFLDRSWVDFYFSIDAKLRCHTYNEKCEKYLVRKAFSNHKIHIYTNDEVYLNKVCLPKSIIWRTKEAFSDGVSSQSRSWYEIIQENMQNYSYDLNDCKKYTINTPETFEQLHYRKIFERLYPNCDSLIPYFWMPRFVDATDSSARTLNIYKNKITNNNDDVK